MRYFIIAAVGVVLELAFFEAFIVVFHLSYLIATPLSTTLIIVLNWYFSRIFVFKGSRHTIHKEFMLVVLASVIGIGIQLLVTAAAVENLKLIPIIGKMLAIFVTFFWNYWFRRRYIFPIETAGIEAPNVA